MKLPEDNDFSVQPSAVSIEKQESDLFSCYHQQCFNQCSDLSKAASCDGAVQCYTSVSKSKNGVEKLERGCFLPGGLHRCNPSTDKFVRAGVFSLFCCKGDWCNNHTITSISPPYEYEYDNSSLFAKLWWLDIILFCALVFVVYLLYIRRKHRKQILASVSSPFDLNGYPKEFNQDTPTIKNVKDDSSKKHVDPNWSSGSGFGYPVLAERNLGKQIKLMELIGKGKYGEVWKGTLLDENVAVKIFFSKDEASWNREIQIYSIFRHPNILYYYGSVMTSRNSITQLWLVTEYHHFGSLYDYLNLNVLNVEQMLKFCRGIAAGINHLHTGIFGVNFEQAKPAIAHRDIKSRNILVKQNGECVLADFGLAATYYERQLTFPSTSRVGTKRYMAPEVLDERINTRSFDSFKRADIYALGLVLWEICRRTSSRGTVDEYKPPFYDCVEPDPSFEEMHQVVCVDQRRPVMSDHWYIDPVLRSLISLMTECWHRNPCVRPTSLRVLKSIIKLCEHVND